jgi:hypothetical protein
MNYHSVSSEAWKTVVWRYIVKRSANHNKWLKGIHGVLCRTTVLRATSSMDSIGTIDALSALRMFIVIKFIKTFVFCAVFDFCVKLTCEAGFTYI